MNRHFNMGLGANAALAKSAFMQPGIMAKAKFFESEHEFSPVFSKEGNPIPHPGLPVLTTPMDNRFPDSYRFVFDPATMVAMDTDALVNGEYLLVHANGGSDRTVTYTAEDEANGVLKKEGGKLVIVKAGDKKTFKANVPAGWTFYFGRQNPYTRGGMVLDEFQIGSQIDLEGFVILPHIYKGENNKYDIKQGDYLAPDNPTDADKALNPKAGHGKWRVWIEAEKDTLADGEIERPNGVGGVVYGKKRDSIRQATAKVHSVVDISEVPRDKSLLATDFDDPNLNMVGPMTNGFLPTYWDFWKYDFEPSGQSKNTNKKYNRKETYNCKLIFALIGKR